MASISFDVVGARKSGYSDAEIADYLGSQSKFDVGGARSSGYSDSEIIDHLSAVRQPVAKPVPDDTQETDEERMARWRESDALGVMISAPSTEKDRKQWGDTLRDIPTQVRAAAASAISGMRAREYAEIERMGSSHRFKDELGLSDAEVQQKRQAATEGELAVAREANADLSEIGQKDRTLLQRGVGTAAQSLFQSGLPLAVGIATRNPVAAAATMMEPTSGQTFGDLANKYADDRAAAPYMEIGRASCRERV